MIDWNDFRVLLAVAGEGTLSGAARRLRVDQSTIGRRLQAMEVGAGARLFDRTPDGYLLTAAGEAVLEIVAEIESRAVAVERKLAGHDARPEGRVRVATSDSFAAWFLIQRLSRLREQHPGVVVELVTGNLAVNLARREADISVRLSKPTQPNLIARRLGEGAWALYASEAYLARRGIPDAKNDLLGHDIIGYDDELAGTVGFQWLRAHASRAAIVLTSNSLLSQAAAVVAGLGVSALPCLFGDIHSDLRRVAPGIIGHHEIWLVVHPDVKTSARVRAVMEYLMRVIQEEKPLLSGTGGAGGQAGRRVGRSRTPSAKPGRRRRRRA